MSAIRFFMDEDVYGAVAPALRRAGLDAIATTDTGRGGESDESQLDWATSENRVLVTFNVGHFARLHSVRIAESRQHAGIVVSSQRPIGDMIRRLQHLAKALDAESMRDRLEFLSDW
jgi:uncharacterized protein with PIN domain